MIINKNSLGALGFFLPPLDKLACRHGVEGEAGCVKADTALFSPPWPSLGGGWCWLGPCQGVPGVSEVFCISRRE